METSSLRAALWRREAIQSPRCGLWIASAPKGASRVLLAAGRPLNEPVARYGPFVMNTDEQLRQAMIDYQAGRF